jgi:hypothetical protein
VHTDGREHPVHVETRAHCLADLAQRLELLHLPSQLGASLLELLHQFHLADRHRRLAGEGGDDRHLALVERTDLVAPQRDRADDLAVDYEGCRDRGAEAGHSLQVQPAVLGVGHDVGDLLGSAVQPDPADECLAVHRHRVLGDVGDRLVRDPDRLDQPVDAVLEGVEVRGVGAAQPAGALDDGGEDGVRVTA